jgi:hypothetical protein
MRVDWHSLYKRTFFPQVSTELTSWHYIGALHFGTGDHTGLIQSSSDKTFCRLRYSDLPVVTEAEAEDADFDLDSISNIEELEDYHTDPLDADSDKDGLPDGWEVAHGISPLDDGAVNAANGPDGEFGGGGGGGFTTLSITTNATAFAAGVGSHPLATLADLDGDGIPNERDAGPKSIAVDWETDGQPAKFLFAPLPGYNYSAHGSIIGCNDLGDVIAERALYSGGAWHVLTPIATESPNYLSSKIRVNGREHDAYVRFQPSPNSVSNNGKIVGSATVRLEPISEEVTPGEWVTYSPASTRMAFLWDSWSATPHLLAHASGSVIDGNLWDETPQIAADGSVTNLRRASSTNVANTSYVVDRYTPTGMTTTPSYPSVQPAVMGNSGFLAFNEGVTNAYSWLPGAAPVSLMADSIFSTPNPRTQFHPWAEPVYLGEKPGAAGGYCINFWGKAMIRSGGRWRETVEMGDATLVTKKGIAFRGRAPNAIQVWKSGSTAQTLNDTVLNKSFTGLYTYPIDSTADGSVLIEYYGAGGQIGRGFLVPVDIEEVISDQISGNEANKLPTAFYVGAPNNPMLMATRSGTSSHLAVRMNVPSSHAPAVRVGIRVVGETTIIGSAPAVSSPARTLLPFTAQNGAKMYEVVAGYDSDGDGALDPEEAVLIFEKTPKTDSSGAPVTTGLGNLDKIIVVTESDFVDGKIDCITNNVWGTDYAGDLISAFAHGTTSVDEATTTSPHVIMAMGSGLSHQVGARWDSAFNAETHKVSWYDGSEASNDVKASYALPQVLHDAILLNLAAIKAGTPLGGAWGNSGTYPFSISRNLLTTEDEWIGINELGYAFGKITFNGTITVNSRWVAGGKVEVGTVSYSSQFEDTYDFSYWGGSKARQASFVQAGHATLSSAAEPESGKAFFTKVVFNGTRNINEEF